MVIGKNAEGQTDLFQVTVATNTVPNGSELGDLGRDHESQQNNDRPHCNPLEHSQRTAWLALFVVGLVTRAIASIFHFAQAFRTVSGILSGLLIALAIRLATSCAIRSAPVPVNDAVLPSAYTKRTFHERENTPVRLMATYATSTEFNLRQEMPKIPRCLKTRS